MKHTAIISVLLTALVVSGCRQQPKLPDPPKDLNEVMVPDQTGQTADDPTWGQANAPLKMVVFSDFQCPFCREFFGNLDQTEQEWINTGKLQVQFRDFPLAKHANSLSAHMAAEAANQQGKYLEMHHLLYEKQDEWAVASRPDELFVAYAKQIGLDEDQFAKDYNDPQYFQEIKQDRDQGRALGISGTPGFILNGELYQGVMNKERLFGILETTFTNL